MTESGNSGRRRRKPKARPAPQRADAFRASERPGRALAGFLGEDDVALMRARCLGLLEGHGVEVRHPQAATALIGAGARPGAGPDRLCLPRALVEEALRETPKTARLCGKTETRDIVLPRADGGFVARTGTGAHGYIDPRDARYRNTDAAALADIAAVAEGLGQVGFVAHPFLHGVAAPSADIPAFAGILGHTTKHCWIQPYSKQSVGYLMRMAAVAAGGEAALRDRPLASCITCSFSPLEFKHMDTECIVQAGRFGLPLHACSLPSAGGSAPLAPAGMLLMAGAEIVAMVTMAHVLAPGVPVIATPLMFTLDMASGAALMACPESVQMAAMAVQLMKQGFGLVAHSYGLGSDAPDADHQSMAERAGLAQAVARAGADILGGVGQLETATVFSPVQAVLDDEIAACVRKLLEPPEISVAAMGWDEVLSTPPGGHFLDRPHTVARCREQFAPRIFQRQRRDDYERADRRAAFEAARDRALELIAAAPEEGYLDPDQHREIAALVSAGESAVLEATRGPITAI